VKGNIIILWRIADTIVPLLKHLLSEGACAADSEAATNSRSWRPPSGRSSCRVSWCCVSIEEQRWTRLVQALLGALNSQKSRPEESASRSGPPLRLLLDGAVDAAPSLTTSSGVAEPAPACSWKNAPVSVSSFEPVIRVEQNLAVVLADAPGGDHRLTGWPARSPSAISSNYRLSGIRTACLVKASYSAHTRSVDFARCRG
jgi:hypothetical protein